MQRKVSGPSNSQIQTSSPRPLHKSAQQCDEVSPPQLFSVAAAILNLPWRCYLRSSGILAVALTQFRVFSGTSCIAVGAFPQFLVACLWMCSDSFIMQPFLRSLFWRSTRMNSIHMQSETMSSGHGRVTLSTNLPETCSRA